MATTRRTFMQVGALAALALAAGGGIYRATHGAAPARRFVLDGDAKAVLDAIVPAMLDGALPPDPAARGAAIAAAAERTHLAILSLPLATQKEIADLFGLLALGPARRWLAGVPDAWTSAGVEQVGAFLQGWRTSRFATLQTAYRALHDLIIGPWYADPSTWDAIGYPGPIKELGA